MKKSSRGFSILEVFAVITLLAILVIICTPYLANASAAISRVRCTSNLKNLHLAFENYLQDNKVWPQQPDFAPENIRDYEEFWIKAMEPYVGSKKMWLCPMLVKQKLKDGDGRLLEMHYTPTPFDANPISPRRWPTMPWLMENGNIHGKGPLILKPDGAVVDFYTISP